MRRACWISFNTRMWFYSFPTVFKAKTQYKVRFVEIQGQLIQQTTKNTARSQYIMVNFYRSYNPNGLNGLWYLSTFIAPITTQRE